jgi:hypothetical protein
MRSQNGRPRINLAPAGLSAHVLFRIAFICLLLPVGPVFSVDNRIATEEAQFTVYISGKELGREKFSIQNFDSSIKSSSVGSFHNLGNKQQNVRIETRLEMDTSLQPKSYEIQMDSGGPREIILGAFIPNQATFEYRGTGSPRRKGLLVGDAYSLLDSNVFHHFIFIARKYVFDFKDKPQSFEVVVPQELHDGTLKVREIGMEKVSVQGKNRDLHHLRADSGRLAIDLWVDDNRILYKIALPSKNIEVVRR